MRCALGAVSVLSTPYGTPYRGDSGSVVGSIRIERSTRVHKIVCIDLDPELDNWPALDRICSCSCSWNPAAPVALVPMAPVLGGIGAISDQCISVYHTVQV